MQEILQSFLTLPNAVILAAATWLIKSSYNKYVAEKRSIGIFERIYAQNLRILDDSIEFMNQWIDALKNNNNYSCYFEELVIDDTNHLHISDLNLVNILITTNYIQRRANHDLKNTYKVYQEMHAHFREKNLLASDEFKISNQTALNAVLSIKEGLEKFVIPDTIKAIAYLQLAGKTKEHSIYGYLNLLDMNIFPRITEAKVKDRINKINSRRTKS